MLGWNTPLYSGLAHLACIELDLHHNKLKLLSHYLVNETTGTERYEGKEAPVLAYSGRDKCIPKPFCLFCFKLSCVSWNQTVMGSITPCLGCQQPGTASSTGLQRSKLPEPWCMPRAGPVNLKSRAWHREWLISCDRNRRITKHQFLQKNISQGMLSPLLKISLEGPLWRSSRSRCTLGTEEEISTYSAIETPYILSQWSQWIIFYGILQEALSCCRPV